MNNIVAFLISEKGDVCHSSCHRPSRTLSVTPLCSGTKSANRLARSIASGAAVRLRELDYLIGKGFIDEDYDFEQWPGLATPADLLARLRATIPNEDLVFSHGDLCDNNVFVDQRGELHFIDAGRGGRADRWLDIAFIHRNLRDDVSERSAAQFLEGLGVPDAPAKREFFEQLDELF